jgi:outer membrane protein TolC
VSGSGKDPVIAMVSLNLPIWGKSNKAAERQAKMQLAKTSSAKLQKENDIIAQLADVIYDFEDANRKIKLYRNILIPKAREMLEASEVAYRAAQIDFLSLIDAQRKLLNFELLHERAVTDNQQTLAQVQMLTGTETRQEQFASSK